MSSKPKVVAVVGPTASGKTSLSIEIATHFAGEVISADSRQVYRGLDIGSGKVTREEMAGIPHHLIDIVDVNTIYTAADFARDAVVAIEKIVANDHLPIIAGGTFFYIDQLRGFSLPNVPPNLILRAELEQLSTSELFQRLETADKERAKTIDRNNRRRLIRSLEIADAIGAVPPIKQDASPYEWLILGIQIDPHSLRKNIHERLLQRLDAGMVEEVRGLFNAGISKERLDDLGLEYRYVSAYLNNTLSYEEMIEKLETKIWQFAKRQMTWLKRDTEINWITKDDQSTAFAQVEAFLSR